MTHEHSSAPRRSHRSILMPRLLTCCTLHTGQPAVDVVAHFAERRLDDGCAQNGCGSSDLRVSMVNKAQNIADILLLCKGPEI